MEKEKMLQIVVPAIAVAAIIVVVAFIVVGTAPPSDDTKPGSGKAPQLAAGKKMVAEVAINSDGVGLAPPDLNSPEWKDIGNGLKAWDAKVGEGDVAIVETDDGLWHYTGWRPDGFVFDSSLRKTGDPISFNLRSVIKGWTLGLVGMKAGGVRRLYIPSALAYGAQGQGKDIPGNTDLLFEVKLLRISR